MALEGALKDLGLSEVVQLLAAGKRTGTLRVSGGAGARGAILRFVEGFVTGGRWDDEPEPLLTALGYADLVTDDDTARAARWASEQDPPRALVDGLVELQCISARTRDTVARRLMDDLCFELTTFSDGWFTFTDGLLASTIEPTSGLRLSGEELFLDATRRRDEWPSITERIGSLGAVPVICDQQSSEEIALAADAWRVLACVDGCRTIRQVASSAGLRLFEAARWIARWAALGVVSTDSDVAQVRGSEAAHGLEPLLNRGNRALLDGQYEAALAAARTAMAQSPRSAAAYLIAGRALLGLGRRADWADEVAKAVSLDPALPEARVEHGYVAASRGDYASALTAWEQYLADAPHAPDAARVLSARDAAATLHDLLATHAGR
jgi:cytochrome c-type biogenesis protein CcmH/NrfG